jgi:hypothetical protein
MRTFAKVAIGAALVATATTGLIPPAAARADDGAAVVAGIIGLGIGAAIASDHHYHRHYYNRYYYGRPSYYYGYGYAPRYYYGPPAYAYPYGGYGYGYRCGWNGCW